MQNAPVKLSDVVALLVDKPEEGLGVGQVGTVVEVLAPDAYEVEFLDSKGKNDRSDGTETSRFIAAST